MEDFQRKRFGGIVAAFAVLLAFPFYLGFVHVTLPQLLLYSAGASAAMATGEYADTPKPFRGGPRVLFSEALLWLLVILAVGGCTYLVALLF